MTPAKITVQNTPITITAKNNNDYICITDMAKARNDDSRAADIIKNWIRNRATLEFLGTWELLYNPDFKVVEFDHLRMQAGLPTFTLSIGEWIEKTNAIGLTVERGRYGGTYAHKDIAFEFGSAISPTFKLYLIKEYQRLKEQDNDPQQLEWNAKRFLTKTNYLIQTDAVKNYIIPQTNYTKTTEWLAYADEADLINVALFGCTAKQWRDANPELAKTANIRDYATINELAILSNLQTHNAELIKQNISKEQRFTTLTEIARYQTKVLTEAEKIRTNPQELKP
ncbi:KilA-N domain-containing protein [Methanocorpusculum sp. MG]|uniref:KilA-N domain-containing protein n=1 Tax=Methanocorpusculum petauri TaxID=3002863 RepID=A0ABT4IF36_9EURY|nr:KilA-N domain-containing protein [Methanocorpusculum petauri]MCZ0859743.1 KilA-N domain-containing protein [Methanocorpusculum petauri]